MPAVTPAIPTTTTAFPDPGNDCQNDGDPGQDDDDDGGASDDCDTDDDDHPLHADDQCPTAVPERPVDQGGCSIADLCPCEDNWRNHGAYVRCVAHASNDFRDAGLITEREKGEIVSAAARSDCGDED